jgi:predicted  nucleic acid-binding Zn-ribbon protein
MGPTNVALVKLFQVDQKLRQAQGRLDVATKDVRVQERRVHDLAEKHKLAQNTLRETQSKAGNMELDLRARDAHIEKLRGRQQNTTNNKEYQAILIEISTCKTDRNKVEEETMKLLETVERGQADLKAMAEQLEGEKAKLISMQQQMSGRVAELTAEIEAIRPERAAVAATVPEKAQEVFDRLADRFDGEAMSALTKPDRRREEYACSACNMDLVANVYNKLHSRDEMVFCPSCSRILYIPEELPPELAIGTGSRGKSATPRKTRTKKAGSAASGGAETATTDASNGGEVMIEQRAKGRIGELLAAAQGESVTGARDADQKPVECEVFIDGELAGIYKGKSVEHLERVIKFRLEEAQQKLEVRVQAIATEPQDGTVAASAETASASHSESEAATANSSN